MSKVNTDYEYLFKIVLVGDSGVGKSCLLLRFADDNFTSSHICTIGVDFRFRRLTVGNKTVKMQIWDTAGQERFRTMSSAYYRGAHGIVIVYDVTNQKSFDNIEDWITEVNHHASKNSIKVLVGNKADLDWKRLVNKQQAKAMAESIGISFLETSAKDSTNVEEAFVTMAEQLVRAKDSSAKEMIVEDIDLEVEQLAKESSCC